MAEVWNDDMKWEILKETADRIIDEEAEREGITGASLAARGSTAIACRARNRAALRMREELGMSLKQIGFYLNRDHSTIIHSIKQARKYA